jgi:hypothetical protein
MLYLESGSGFDELGRFIFLKDYCMKVIFVTGLERYTLLSVLIFQSSL